MTLEKALKQIELAIEAAKQRKEIEHFSDKKNITELLFDIEYRINPPVKTGRAS